MIGAYLVIVRTNKTTLVYEEEDLVKANTIYNVLSKKYNPSDIKLYLVVDAPIDKF